MSGISDVNLANAFWAQQGAEWMRPFRQLGTEAIDPYKYALGMGEAPEGYDLEKQIMGLPFTNTLIDRGLEKVKRKSATTGGLGSGPMLKGMYDYATQQVMLPTYQDYMNRLFGAIQGGQNASGTMAGIGMQAAGNMTNALMQDQQMQMQKEYADSQRGGGWLGELAGGLGLLGGIAMSPVGNLNNSLMGKALGWAM